MEDEERSAEHPTERLDAPPTLIEPSPLQGKAGRNLKLAIATGLTLAALVIGLLWLGPKPFFALAFVVILVAQGEFYANARKAGHDPATALGIVAGGVMLLGVFTRGERAAGLVLFLTLVFSFLWYMALERRRDFVGDIAITVLGVVYIPMLGAFAALLANVCRAGDCPPRGGGLILVMIAGAAFYDIGAYAGGSRFGKTLLAPTISPKKTREGAIAGSITTVVIITAFAPVFGPWNTLQAFVLSLFICVAAPLGDLFESMLKRDLGVKDSGTIFPGHGGALDRIDAILFVAPVIYVSLLAIGYVHPVP